MDVRARFRALVLRKPGQIDERRPRPHCSRPGRGRRRALVPASGLALAVGDDQMLGVTGVERFAKPWLRQLPEQGALADVLLRIRPHYQQTTEQRLTGDCSSDHTSRWQAESRVNSQ